MDYNSNVSIYFGVVISQKEERGGYNLRNKFREKTEDFIWKLDLIHIVPKKGKYAWENHEVGPGHIVACLDHFLDHSDFFLEDLSISSGIIPLGMSNH